MHSYPIMARMRMKGITTTACEPLPQGLCLERSSFP